MKIAICTGVWKRPNIFEYFAKGVKALTGAEIKVFVAGSEGRQSRYMVRHHGFTYAEVPNMPLGCKMNLPVQRAAEWKPDYFLMLGSDDIIHPDLFAKYLEIAKAEKPDLIGVRDFYFYNSITKQAIYWGGYLEKWRRGSTCGAGRMLSDSLMQKLNWEPFDNEISRLLDSSLERKLSKIPTRQHTFKMKDLGLFAVDIKSELNMTPFRQWSNSTFVPVNLITDNFKYIF